MSPADNIVPDALTPADWRRKEAAHVLLHAEAPGLLLPRGLKEVEAESVAFVVAAGARHADGRVLVPLRGGLGGRAGPRAVTATQSRVAQAAKAIIAASPAEHTAGGRVPGVEVAIERAARPLMATASPAPEAEGVPL